MIWRKLCHIKVFLLTLLLTLCLIDVGITYYVLENFPTSFQEVNPIGLYLINLFGLRGAVLILSPILYLVSMVTLYALWNYCDKKNKTAVLALIGIGYVCAITVRIAAVCWNFYQLHKFWL